MTEKLFKVSSAAHCDTQVAPDGTRLYWFDVAFDSTSRALDSRYAVCEKPGSPVRIIDSNGNDVSSVFLVDWPAGCPLYAELLSACVVTDSMRSD